MLVHLSKSFFNCFSRLPWLCFAYFLVFFLFFEGPWNWNMILALFWFMIFGFFLHLSYPWDHNFPFLLELFWLILKWKLRARYLMFCVKKSLWSPLFFFFFFSFFSKLVVKSYFQTLFDWISNPFYGQSHGQMSSPLPWTLILPLCLKIWIIALLLLWFLKSFLN